jgi:hypothetical protein
MPDIIDVLVRRWQLILALTVTATVLALIVSLLRPKEYLSTATALPANSVTADKARIFNNNIEGLYSELGSPDELDRIEGTAKLDTIFLAVASDFDLPAHYALKNSPDAIYKAASVLKKKTDIRRSAYGELKINVWDSSAALAAQLANALMQKLNDVHQQVQNVNNAGVLQALEDRLKAKQKLLESLGTEVGSYRGNSLSPNSHEQSNTYKTDTGIINPDVRFSSVYSQITVLQSQVKEYRAIIGRYELAVTTSPQVLIPVEKARPAIAPDRPKVLQTTLFAFGASLLFSFLLAFFAESRRQKA